MKKLIRGSPVMFWLFSVFVIVLFLTVMTPTTASSSTYVPASITIFSGAEKKVPVEATLVNTDAYAICSNKGWAITIEANAKTLTHLGQNMITAGWIPRPLRL